MARHKYVDGVAIALTPSEEAALAAAEAAYNAPEAVAARARSSIRPITTRQFFLQATKDGLITSAEALAATSGAKTMPTTIATVIGSLSADEQMAARITWNTMTIIGRDEPLVALCAAAFGLKPSQTDDFFIQAVSL